MSKFEDPIVIVIEGQDPENPNNIRWNIIQDYDSLLPYGNSTNSFNLKRFIYRLKRGIPICAAEQAGYERGSLHDQCIDCQYSLNQSSLQNDWECTIPPKFDSGVVLAFFEDCWTPFFYKNNKGEEYRKWTSLSLDRFYSELARASFKCIKFIDFSITRDVDSCLHLDRTLYENQNKDSKKGDR